MHDKNSTFSSQKCELAHTRVFISPVMDLLLLGAVAAAADVDVVVVGVAQQQHQAHAAAWCRSCW